VTFHALQILAVSGLTSCTAERLEGECLEVLIVGTPEALRSVAQLMMQGPLDAEFRGKRFRLNRFTVQNQGDRERLVFRADHGPV
jgi:hypothetical protein